MSVQLRTQGGLVALGRIVDLSLSGALVQTALQVPLLSRLQLTVALDRRHKAQVDAQVVRQTEVGVAVEWSEFGNDAIQALLAHRRPAQARAG
jgi:PilZ domain-containing protein